MDDKIVGTSVIRIKHGEIVAVVGVEILSLCACRVLICFWRGIRVVYFEKFSARKFASWDIMCAAESHNRNCNTTSGLAKGRARD